uniref:Uncharacterized protein n=1 Tax=Glossina pallidipes TaxID=7398 RepID=A0A1B0AEG3_GLOPL
MPQATAANKPRRAIRRVPLPNGRSSKQVVLAAAGRSRRRPYGGCGNKAAGVQELRGLLCPDSRPNLSPEKKNPRTGVDKNYEVKVKPSLATLIFATKVESVAELKAECKKAEKLLKESRARLRHINEIVQEGRTIDEARNQTVEAFVPRQHPGNSKQHEERRQF